MKYYEPTMNAELTQNAKFLVANNTCDFVKYAAFYVSLTQISGFFPRPAVLEISLACFQVIISCRDRQNLQHLSSWSFGATYNKIPMREVDLDSYMNERFLIHR